MKKIGIIGCGWLGIRISKHLQSGYKLYTTTTSEEKKSELIAMGLDSVAIQFSDDEVTEELKNNETIQEMDALIITVPFSKRTPVNQLKNRFENISLFIGEFKKPVFLMSSIGIYPQMNISMDESYTIEEHLEPTLLSIEKLMKFNYPKINILRLGGLMGDNRVFSNYTISDPDQAVNHVHYEDICLIIEKMINMNITSKTYNVVAPEHPTKQEVINYQKNIPAGASSADKKSQRIISSKNLESDLGYVYKNPDPKKFNDRKFNVL
ncbi:hypothetical protein IW15_19820 [Chryseobacterium soli]|uniref:Epimerase n=1 Tax=Chryseobacterium soli TaxID=445961 RepID=A0A086A1M0_9FLAO|nr:hypothetical protein [Chryseobacterium soli]KFF10584.1 hypothetical protein IW15_19820 [Chryseobacterium soli]